MRNSTRRAALAIALGTLLCCSAHAITPAQIQARGKIIIGIQAANPPWGFIDPASDKADGIDGDVGRRFARELGVEVEFVGLEVANRIPALTSSRVDVLFATMAMLPERARAVQFSKPYVANAIVLVAPKSTPIKTNADMGKLTIGVVRSAQQDAEVSRNAPAGASILRFDSDAASIKAMLSGQVQAVAGNIFYARRLNEVKPGGFETKLEFSKLYNGACSRLGDKDLNAALNAFIDKLKANGELARIQEKWMGASNTSFPDAIEGISFVAK